MGEGAEKTPPRAARLPLTTPRPSSPSTHPHTHHSEEISQARMNRIRGVDNVARLDEELYHDFETDADRAVSGGR